MNIEADTSRMKSYPLSEGQIKVVSGMYHRISKEFVPNCAHLIR